jgi:PAS domain S-box-containing protein
VGVQRLSQAPRVRARADRQGTSSRSGRGIGRSQALFERMPVAGFFTDAAFRIRGWNPAAERIFGYGRSELVGRPATETLASAGQRGAALAAFRRVACGETVTCTFDTLAKDGGAVPCEWTGTPYADRRGAFAGMIAMAVDVSDRRRAAAALQESERELVQALDRAEQANRSKNEFLANMSHELRTPLNAVIGFSDILRHELMGPIGERKYVEYAGDIHDSGMHLLRIIEDVLDLSKLEAGQLRLREETIDLAELCRGCARLVQMQAEAGGIVLEVALPSGLPSVRADAVRLKQVLVNLLSNAVKFTPAGGWVRLGAETGARGLTLSVSDTGIGMREQDIPLALERFGQIENALGRRQPGTGLGLPLSKHLVELHGGRLAIESRYGFGTTVRVNLPEERLVR